MSAHVATHACLGRGEQEVRDTVVYTRRAVYPEAHIRQSGLLCGT
jgi:hypothetical protein